MSNRPVSVARTKTRNVQREMRVAKADLHDSNVALSNSASGAVVPAEAVEAALAQNVEVEEKLHEAVQELEVVSELLNVAQAKNAEHDGQTMAGHRSGVGLQSVMEHMTASAQRRARRDADAPAAPRPADIRPAQKTR
jgi:hypothetical protein